MDFVNKEELNKSKNLLDSPSKKLTSESHFKS